MSDPIVSRLAEVQARVEALTYFDDEQWQIFYSTVTKEPIAIGPDNFTEQFQIDGMSEDDAKFVAAAPDDVKFLLAVIKGQREAIEKALALAEAIMFDTDAEPARASIIAALTAPTTQTESAAEIEQLRQALIHTSLAPNSQKTDQ